MKRIFLGLVSVLLPCNFALAQVHSGSVAIFVQDADKFIVAADSRGGHVRGSRPRTDDECKLFALQENAVFFTTGAVRYESGKNDPISSWSNEIEARSAIHLHGTDEGTAQHMVDEVANAWAKSSVSKWNQLYRRDPKWVTLCLPKGSGVVTTGIFAMAKNGSMAYALRDLSLIGKEIKAVDDKCTPGHGERGLVLLCVR